MSDQQYFQGQKKTIIPAAPNCYIRWKLTEDDGTLSKTEFAKEMIIAWMIIEWKADPLRPDRPRGESVPITASGIPDINQLDFAGFEMNGAFEDGF
jgi:hypothetical protein